MSVLEEVNLFPPYSVDRCIGQRLLCTKQSSDWPRWLKCGYAWGSLLWKQGSLFLMLAIDFNSLPEMVTHVTILFCNVPQDCLWYFTWFLWENNWSYNEPLLVVFSRKDVTHTHRYIYIYIYIYKPLSWHGPNFKAWSNAYLQMFGSHYHILNNNFFSQWTLAQMHFLSL